VQQLTEKFGKTGSLADVPKSGRPHILRQDNVLDIPNHIIQSSKKSICKLSQQAGILHSPIKAAFKKELHLHLYKMSLHKPKKCDNPSMCNTDSDLETSLLLTEKIL
jgi:hypothetical protein